MFKMFRTNRPAGAPSESESAGPGVAPAPAMRDLQAMIRTIGKQASSMGKEAAEVRGQIEDTNKASARHVQTLAALAGQVREITRSQDHISSVSRGSLGAVARARLAVEQVANEVAGIVTSLQQVSQAAGTITQIALQTRLVAFNASVEAKRAGDAGRGFGVVADAVKDLAGKVESTSKDIMGTVAELDERIAALAREIARKDGADAQARNGQAGAFHKALADVESSVSSVTAAAEQSRGICAGLNAQMATTEAEMTQTGRTLDSTLERSEVFLKISEELIEQVASAASNRKTRRSSRPSASRRRRSASCWRIRCARAGSPRPTCSTRTTASSPAPTRRSTPRASST